MAMFGRPVEGRFVRSLGACRGRRGLGSWVGAAVCAGVAAWVGLAGGAAKVRAADANRLVYLDQDSPFYVGLEFPRLATPQWVGEPGVEAVVTLGIDDLTGNAPKYEAFLRPILERLKQVEHGKAPLSVFCNAVDPEEPLLQQWIRDGVSIEVHTLSHPCPILAKGNLKAAVDTFLGGIDLIGRIPNNRPVAFRTPCCDSINSPSPRLYSEIFRRRTEAGAFLKADSSVMNVFTSRDPALPDAWTRDARGEDRFRPYLPNVGFSTIVENYPYPYVLGRLCWEFPGVVPSDWEAQHRQGITNAVTVSDWAVAVDATVLKQGSFNLIFHPHGWIRSDQVADWIGAVRARHGEKVRFLNFRDAVDRLERNLLGGESLRRLDGGDNGVRLLDVNNDGYLDVVIANDRVRRTRVWKPLERRWEELGFPRPLVSESGTAVRGRFAILDSKGRPAFFVLEGGDRMAWVFDGKGWAERPEWVRGLEADGARVETVRGGRDGGLRFRDVTGDGVAEAVVGNESQNAVFEWDGGAQAWRRASYGLPPGVAIVNEEGGDAGLRFVDINEDGFDDVLFSNERQGSLHLYIPKPVLGWTTGWTREVIVEERGDDRLIPPVVRGRPSEDNGVWFSRRTLWVQNEDTAHLPDLVERRTFDQLLAGYVPKPKSPEASLADLEVAPGFVPEIVAAEPLVEDPVAFDWDARGRLWVVEMGDYPLGLDAKGKPGGQIRILEDVDRDGRYDRFTVFLDGLGFPNGILPWRRGVLISAAPDILYAEDVDGDGRADVRKVLYTGFRPGNQQHRVNGFDYGLDGWVYGANGDSGGRVTSVALGYSVSVDGRDFRIRPETGEIEAIEGQTQFGRHRDDWGNWFGNHNGTWGWHYHLPDAYVGRNPRLVVEGNKTLLAAAPGGTRLYPVARSMQRFNLVGETFHCSSANSLTPYRDALFGGDFERSVFVSDPVYNLVHREVLEAGPASFSSHRAAGERDREFVASRDAWFRPTQLKTGPDGALYIADMYRLVIEHPEWIPADVASRLDLRAGSKQGRIYRVRPERWEGRGIPDLERLKGVERVAALNSSNGWQRDMAQRLIVERGGEETIAPLRRLAREAADAKVRVQALWTLEGLGRASDRNTAWMDGVLARAMADSHWAVREHALRISEPRLRRAPVSSKLVEAVLACVEDEHPRVRLQLAWTLGECRDARAGDVLARLATMDRENPVMMTAVLSSLPGHAERVLARMETLESEGGVYGEIAREARILLGREAVVQRKPSGKVAGPRGAERGDRRVEGHGDRAQLVREWIGKVEGLKGDLARGAAVYQAQCGACHRRGTVGKGAGPDLGALSDYSVGRLVEAILDPNRVVDDRYRTYVAELKSGDRVTGLLTHQGPNSVSLAKADGERETILRSELVSLDRVDASLMPEGLEGVLSPQSIADVIEYLRAR